MQHFANFYGDSPLFAQKSNFVIIVDIISHLVYNKTKLDIKSIFGEL